MKIEKLFSGEVGVWGQGAGLHEEIQVTRENLNILRTRVPILLLLYVGDPEQVGQ